VLKVLGFEVFFEGLVVYLGFERKNFILKSIGYNVSKCQENPTRRQEQAGLYIGLLVYCQEPSE